MRNPLLAVLCALVAAASIHANEQQMLEQFAKELPTTIAALAEDPKDTTVLSRIGDLHLFLQQYPQAVTAFGQMIAIDPLLDAPHWRLGIAYYFSGQYEKSAHQFAKYHAYDARDRENGVWKFLAQARLSGLETARREMLPYTRFDREPFPVLYEMFAGVRTPQSVLDHAAAPALAGDRQVQFFAHYYMGLMLDLNGDRTKAVEHLKHAVAVFSPTTAQQGGPGYMWQVARLHLAELSKPTASPTPLP